MLLPIHNIAHSCINGPGNRLVIWVQGCKFHCKGCFNPETHPYTKDHLIDINELAYIINNDADIEGITLSGGEPLDYPHHLEGLFNLINPKLTIILYSGYTVNEINEKEQLRRLLKRVDLSIVGRFDETLPHPYLGKKFVLSTDRVSLEYFRPKQMIEYNFSGEKITKTGVFKL